MNTTQGKLIVLEGGDGSGKATQAGLLKERLEREGAQVFLFDFPQYETTRAGALAGECLAGKHANFRHLSPYLASLPFTLDRVSARERLLSAFASGVVLTNRYTPSNIAYQSAKLLPQDRPKFIEFLEGLEYDELGLPRPSAVIYLHVPVSIASDLIARKDARGYLAGSADNKKDQYERDTAYQEEVQKVYLALAAERPDWHRVECTRDGLILSRDEIHQQIYNLVHAL